MEYIKYMRTVPEALRPIPRITEQVARATREAMTGQPKQVVNAAVHKAKRDVVFLIKLHDQVNIHFMVEERVWFAVFAGLEAKLRAITYGNILRQQKKARSPVAREDKSWKAIADVYITQIYAFRQAAMVISQHYFDGEDVLFSDIVDNLAGLIEFAEDLVQTFNQDVAKKPKETMNLKALQKSTEEKEAKQRVSYLVDMAKAEALDAMGEDKEAEEIAARHLQA